MYCRWGGGGGGGGGREGGRNNNYQGLNNANNYQGLNNGNVLKENYVDNIENKVLDNEGNVININNNNKIIPEPFNPINNFDSAKYIDSSANVAIANFDRSNNIKKSPEYDCNYNRDIEMNENNKMMRDVKKSIAVINTLTNACSSDYKYDTSNTLNKIINNKMENINRQTWIKENYGKLKIYNNDFEENNKYRMPCFEYANQKCKTLYNLNNDKTKNYEKQGDTDLTGIPLTEFKNSTRFTPSAEINLNYIKNTFN
jgi:hypothetical protein